LAIACVFLDGAVHFAESVTTPAVVSTPMFLRP
jgi:hypothetical protein